jgi:hypothetical protein
MTDTKCILYYMKIMEFPSLHEYYGDTVYLGWTNYDGQPIAEGFNISDNIGEVCLRLEDKSYWVSMRPDGLKYDNGGLPDSVSWNVERISKCPNLSLEFVRAHPDKNWNLKELSKRQDVTKEFLEYLKTEQEQKQQC